jgi:hypothetical protein
MKRVKQSNLLILCVALAFASSSFGENTKKRPAGKRIESSQRRPTKGGTRVPSTRQVARPAPQKDSAQQRQVSSMESDESRQAAETVAANSYQAVTATNPSFLFSSGFGVQVLDKPGLALQGQLLFSVNKKRTYYLGPDITYTLYAPGSSLTAAIALWYELKVYGAPRLSCLFGLVAGPSFNQGVGGFSNTTYALFLDLALVQEVDDLISVKGQFRPGILGGTFTYVMGFQVAFRFL